MKTIDLLKEGTMLPPPSGTCQECAVKHIPEDAHDGSSLYYQYAFRKQHGCWPTWKDAIAHCEPERKKFWIEQLKKHDIDAEK